MKTKEHRRSSQNPWVPEGAGPALSRGPGNTSPYLRSHQHRRKERYVCRASAGGARIGRRTDGRVRKHESSIFYRATVVVCNQNSYDKNLRLSWVGFSCFFRGCYSSLCLEFLHGKDFAKYPPPKCSKNPRKSFARRFLPYFDVSEPS